MARVMESLWTSRPRWSVMACMVWLSVRVYWTNPNGSPAASEDVRAALPARATRDSRNGNHIALFNPEPHGRLWPVSHKVWAT